MTSHGHPLRDLRRANGLSQVDLSRRLGIAQATVSNRESEPCLSMNLKTLIDHIRAIDPTTILTASPAGAVLESQHGVFVIKVG